MLVKSLNELVPIIGERVPEARKILSLLCKGKLEILTIFDHFQEHTHATVEEAANAIMGMELTSFKKYGKQLVFYLRKMVALAIEPDADTSESAAQDIITARALVGLKCRYTLRIIAESALERAVRMEVPTIALDATKLLMGAYATADYSQKKEFEHFCAMKKEFEAIAAIHNKADHNYVVHLAFKRHVKGYNKEHHDFLLQSVAEMSPHVGKINSFLFHISYYMLAYNAAISGGNYQEGREAAQQALDYYEARAYNTDELRGMALASIAYCSVMLGELDTAETYFLQSLTYCPPGIINWFACLEMGMHVYLQQKDYAKASEVYSKATRHRKFINLDASTRELWYIMGAYLYVALRIHQQELPKGMTPYKYTKFLNEISSYQYDKNGLYAAALLASLLIAALEKRQDQLIDRMEALEKYRERYLLEGFTPRMALLFKIFLVMAKYGFQPDLYKDKIQGTLNELNAMPRSSFEWEIVPPEQLIEMMGRSNEVAAAAS